MWGKAEEKKNGEAKPIDLTNNEKSLIHRKFLLVYFKGFIMLKLFRNGTFSLETKE